MIDTVMILIFARLFFVAFHNTFFDEIFRLIAVYFASVFALHYYGRLGDVIAQKMLLSGSNTDFMGYLILTFFFIYLFPLVKKGWLHLIEIKPSVKVQKWVLVTLGGIRAYLLCGLIFLGALLTQNGFLVEQAKQSVSQVVFCDVSADIYSAYYHGFIEKIFPGERVNQHVFNVTADKNFEIENGDETSPKEEVF